MVPWPCHVAEQDLIFVHTDFSGTELSHIYDDLRLSLPIILVSYCGTVIVGHSDLVAHRMECRSQNCANIGLPWWSKQPHAEENRD
jgi:hypothetical protein